jgi:hypothetical protein
MSALVVALVAAGLALAGTVTSQTAAAGAAAICAIAFLVPGLALFNYGRLLHLRTMALTHVRDFVEERGAISVDELAAYLSVPRGDADKILRKAIREGHVRGSLDDRGRFISSAAVRCRVCDTPSPKNTPVCPRCGAVMAG